jgi:tRNA G18 (ribose-2'-O)-methylase SpoU
MKLITILHNIRSIHNVGSIFRTADAVGCAKIYLGGITPAPLDRFGLPNIALAKVALGAEKTLEWEKIESTLAVMEKLKQEGYTIIALELDQKAIDLFSKDLKNLKIKKAALIMGAEVEGLPQEILDRSDLIVKIPMRGQKESLNVAVAFGVAAYQLKF